MNNMKRKKHLSSSQIIIVGFISVILIGACLLMLPISTASHVITPFHEALFTSTSAVCVTGLVVHDTASYWSVFGQSIILLLIQIGGLGVITIAVFLALLSGKKISLMQRSTMQEAISAPGIGGIVRLTGFILKATLLFELSGMILMLPVFIECYGIKGIWMSLFHSISAFCNAGFDILGTADAPFVSLTVLSDHVVINVVIMLLIIIGGIGFMTWEDLYVNKLRVKKYTLQTKVVLTTTFLLILIPALIFFFIDFNHLPFKERILYSLFQSVTPRTAGFNTADLTIMSDVSRLLIIILMIIGGSPGSTAGGMKTTTFTVLLANAFSIFHKKDDVNLFNRRIDTQSIRNASTILMMYMTLFISGAMIISIVEDIDIMTCLFETASAIGTVGLTLGITPELGIISEMILIGLMFFGRVGGLTLIFAALSSHNKNTSRLPKERITIG